jgi:nucleoside-diphosphate-sugar epimerase
MNVLITGAGGFIGSHLVEAQLQKGNVVRALDLDLSCFNSWGDRPQLQRIQGDVRDAAVMRRALEEVDAVFHLASAHLSVTIPEEEYWDINVRAAEQLVRLSHIAGVKRFVHCSTVGIYGNVISSSVDEEALPNPDLVYEKSKLAGEQAVLRASQEIGCPVTIVRPVWVYGPRCPRTTKLFRAIRKRTFFLVGNGRTLRHCVYISDMVDGLNLCAERDEAVGQSFIIGDHSAVRVQDLVDEIAAVLNAPSPRMNIPAQLMAPVCTIFETSFKAMGKEPPLSKRSLKFFTNNTSFDISKAKTLLRFCPQITLKDGLRQTYNHLLREGQL